MRFFKESVNESRQVEASWVPIRLRHYLIPQSRVYITKGSFGMVLSQESARHGFTVWQHQFDILRPCTLIAGNERPVLAINYMLQGSPFTKLPAKPEPLLEQGYYRMFYIPRLVQEVTFTEGYYACIHVDYDPSELSAQLAGKYRLRSWLDYLVSRTGMFPYQSGRIDEIVSNGLSSLMSLLSSDSAFQQDAAYKLLLGYIRKHHAFSDELLSAKDYIREHLSEPLKVKELARLCLMSESGFYKQFKARFGLSPGSFLRQVRLEAAMKLLSSTRLPVGEVAHRVGFNDQAFFNRAFKSYFGCAPRSAKSPA